VDVGAKKDRDTGRREVREPRSVGWRRSRHQQSLKFLPSFSKSVIVAARQCSEDESQCDKTLLTPLLSK